MNYELGGSDKFITDDPREFIHIESGTVYVYVISVTGKVIGRRLFLCSVEAGADIPALYAGKPGTKTYYHFLLVAKDKAGICTFEPGQKKEEIRKGFIRDAGIGKGNDPEFLTTVIDWYNNSLLDEQRIIDWKTAERNKVRESKISLMGSLFKDRREIVYEDNTDSVLYNAMSIYCEYLNIRICSYQSLVSSYGDEFTVNDIARLSHFVVRKVKLEKNWYKKYEEPLMGFMSTDNSPVIFVPQKRGSYKMYDISRKESFKVTQEEAAKFKADAIMIYRHLPNKSLTLREVVRYGIRHIDRQDIASFTVMAVFTTLIGLFLPVINELFYDTIIPLGVMDSVWQVGLVMLTVMVGNIFFTLVQNLANYRGVKKVEYAVMAASYDRIFRLPQKFIESFGTMELISRINAIPSAFSSTVSSGISAVVGMILSLFYLWKMFDKSTPLAFRGLIVSVISGVIMYFFGRLRISPEKKRLEHSTDANSVLYRLVSGILMIKTSGIENRGLYEFEKENVKALKKDIKSTRINNMGNAISTMIQMLYTGIIYYTVVKKRQDLTLGEYSAFSAAYGMFTSALNQLVNFFLTRANLIPVMDRIKPIYGQEVENGEMATPAGRLSGRIEVDHLDFTYDDESTPILRDISFKIAPGEYIGIVGPSGCGKSTLLKCMLGFEKATKGKIYYDEKDIDTLDKCDLRRHMGIVIQDGQLVMGNILTNVTLAAPETSTEEVDEILKDVGLYNDILQMPMGIFTNISEGGGTVSGGQKQRILIARALANKPKIIMFDEATSALDNVTQQTVCETLKKRNMTRIMIAHRLSTVKSCDRILVMNEGRIVETGDFEELMAKKGLFYELAKRQMVS